MNYLTDSLRQVLSKLGEEQKEEIKNEQEIKEDEQNKENTDSEEESYYDFMKEINAKIAQSKEFLKEEQKKETSEQKETVPVKEEKQKSQD